VPCVSVSRCQALPQMAYDRRDQSLPLSSLPSSCSIPNVRTLALVGMKSSMNVSPAPPMTLPSLPQFARTGTLSQARRASMVGGNLHRLRPPETAERCESARMRAQEIRGCLGWR
jgi:hypothetical protein